MPSGLYPTPPPSCPLSFSPPSIPASDSPPSYTYKSYFGTGRPRRRSYMDALGDIGPEELWRMTETELNIQELKHDGFTDDDEVKRKFSKALREKEVREGLPSTVDKVREWRKRLAPEVTSQPHTPSRTPSPMTSRSMTPLSPASSPAIPDATSQPTTPHIAVPLYTFKLSPFTGTALTNNKGARSDGYKRKLHLVKPRKKVSRAARTCERNLLVPKPRHIEPPAETEELNHDAREEDGDAEESILSEIFVAAYHKALFAYNQRVLLLLDERKQS